MRINLQQPYMSIASLETKELPNFAVLIGRNGAGKTQLLAALKDGHAVMDGTSSKDIELYDMVSFHSSNSGPANRNANQFAKVTADKYLLAQPGDQALIETATEIFRQYAEDIERTSGVEQRDEFMRDLREEIKDLPDFTVFSDNRERSSPYKKAVYEKVMARLQPNESGRRSSNKADNSFNGNHAALLSAAMKLAGKLPHELTHDDIMDASYYEGATLMNSISAVFATYKVDQFIWAHRRIETESVGFPELMAEYRTKYPPPWETLREILSAMREASGDDGLFDFDFSDPDGHTLHMGNYEQFSFTAQMTNRTSGAKYELDSLSSGEKVLMALCLASFNHYLGRRRPKLLLLDELDAVLHPSMVAALVTTLKSQFVAYGTNVLMTSHSAMTVAALDEADIFRVVRKNGAVTVTRATKSEAVTELSEGLATVDTGLRIAACDKAKVTILTEGYNTRHIKRWVELNFAQDVHVFDELPEHGSAGQLLAYGRLLGRMNTNTHFVIVWDCDAADQAETLRGELHSVAKVTPFAFSRRADNKIARKGIENAYDEKILEPFSFKKVDNDGKVLGRELMKGRKTEFANHVLQHGTSDYFTHFRDLRSVISGLLGRSCEGSSCPDAPES